MTAHEQQLANLQRANERKTTAARAAVQFSLNQLVREGKRVNVNSVSRASGVSRGFIYAHSDLRQIIAEEGYRTKGTVRRSTPLPNTDSLTARLATALDTIQVLKVEKKELERRIENLTAQLIDQSSGS